MFPELSYYKAVYKILSRFVENFLNYEYGQFKKTWFREKRVLSFGCKPIQRTASGCAQSQKCVPNFSPT